MHGTTCIYSKSCRLCSAYIYHWDSDLLHMHMGRGHDILISPNTYLRRIVRVVFRIAEDMCFENGDEKCRYI